MDLIIAGGSICRVVVERNIKLLQNVAEQPETKVSANIPNNRYYVGAWSADILWPRGVLMDCPLDNHIYTYTGVQIYV